MAIGNSCRCANATDCSIPTRSTYDAVEDALTNRTVEGAGHAGVVEIFDALVEIVTAVQAGQTVGGSTFVAVGFAGRALTI